MWDDENVGYVNGERHRMVCKLDYWLDGLIKHALHYMVNNPQDFIKTPDLKYGQKRDNNRELAQEKYHLMMIDMKTPYSERSNIKNLFNGTLITKEEIDELKTHPNIIVFVGSVSIGRFFSNDLSKWKLS